MTSQTQTHQITYYMIFNWLLHTNFQNNIDQAKKVVKTE